MSNTKTTIEKTSTHLIRLARDGSERSDWFVVTATEETSRQKFGDEPELRSGSLALTVRPVNEFELGRGVPTTFGGRFERHYPGLERPTVKVTDGYVIVEDKEHRGRGLGTHLMSFVVSWLQAHARGDAIMFPVEMEPGISEAHAERVRRFYARFGLRFDPEGVSLSRTTGWKASLSSLVIPTPSASITVYGEIDGWLAFFAELRKADELRHGESLGRQWRALESREALARRKTWFKASAAFAVIAIAVMKLLL